MPPAPAFSFMGFDVTPYPPGNRLLLERAEEYRQRGLGRDEASTKPDWGPLHWFAATSSPDPLDAQAAVLAGWDVNGQSDSGDTPLHVAAWNLGRIQMAWLLSMGASPNLANHKGNIPFHQACRKRAVAEALALLEAGSDLSVADAKGCNGVAHGLACLGNPNALPHPESPAGRLWERLAQAPAALWQGRAVGAKGCTVEQSLSPPLRADLVARRLDAALDPVAVAAPRAATRL